MKGRRKVNHRNYLQKNEHLFSLFNKMRQGNSSAFVTLVEQYSDDIYIEAYKITDNSAMSNDIVQEVLSKIYTMDADKFPQKNPMAWLIRVTKNTTISEIRKIPNKMISLDEDRFSVNELLMDERECSSEELVVGNLYMEHLLSELDEISKKIIYLKAVYLWPHHLIAKKLNLPEGTVRWKYREARNRLLKKLDEQKRGRYNDEKR